MSDQKTITKRAGTHMVTGLFLGTTMPLLIRLALLLAMTSPINGMFKGNPPKLADEQAERHNGCLESIRLSYQRACEERQQFEKDNQAIVDENKQALFDNDPKKLDEHRLATQNINAIRAQQLLQKYNQDLEKCRVKNPLTKH